MLSRRKFIRNVGCTGMGALTFMNSVLNLKALNAAAISNSAVASTGNPLCGTKANYKAIVVILLDGGNDSFNMLLPYNSILHQNYLDTRSGVYNASTNPAGLGIELNSILPLSPNGVILDHGIHPNMTGVQNLFNAGKLGFISNIGTLVEPMAGNEFEIKNKPNRLFSHSDQKKQWQTGVYGADSQFGWGGKISDLILDQSNNSASSFNFCNDAVMSMNFAFESNTFQKGANVKEYAIDLDGAVEIVGYNPNSANAFDLAKSRMIDSLLAQNYANVFQRTYIDKINEAKVAEVALKDAYSNFSGFGAGVSFSNSNISQSLEIIAKTIAVQSQLGFERQTFFVRFKEWDHHLNVMQEQPPKLAQLSAALQEFQTALEDIQYADQVVTFNISDFGRTLTSNGNGSDHAWGGNVMVMGGDNLVNGGLIYGNYPDLALNAPQLIENDGRGVVVPTTSTDELFAEVAKWFGVSDTDIQTIFPTITNFWDSYSMTPTLGFLNT